jgi:hypothetical protein
MAQDLSQSTLDSDDSITITVANQAMPILLSVSAGSVGLQFITNDGKVASKGAEGVTLGTDCKLQYAGDLVTHQLPPKSFATIHQPHVIYVECATVPTVVRVAQYIRD